MSTESVSGLVIAGCQPGCGKTVVATGLAATLAEEGFAVKAIKPVCLGDRRHAEPELAFISKISKTPIDYPVYFVRDNETLSDFQWSEILRASRSDAEQVIVELPASCATRLRVDKRSGRWLDTGDLARDLSLPCLLVSSEGATAFEHLVLNATYLIAASLVNVIGLVTVETDKHSTAESIDLASRAIALKERTGVPYLGCLKYSPSISVPAVNQGNLVKTTEAAVDLLPIIKTLNLRLSV